MHPDIKREFKKLLDGPVDNMLDIWKNIRETYNSTDNRLKNVAFDNGIIRPYLSSEDALVMLNSIANKLFTAEISIKKPHLILDFMNEYWGYAFSDQAEYLENTLIYKDACAMDLYNSIIGGLTYPNADPYFNYDPENPVKLSLEHGIERKLFTQSEIDEILKNQDKNSRVYKRLSRLYSKQYRMDHTPFGVYHNAKYNDYGFHVFIGKSFEKLIDNDDRYNTYIDTKNTEGAFYNTEFNYVLLDRSTIELELGKDIECVVDCLWECVRKNQKVLLTKSPGGIFKKLSSEEIFNLYNLYFSDEKHLQLPDPFLSQPK